MPHALTVRLPDQIYRAAKNMARGRGISMNRLVQEALAEKAEHAIQDRMKRAYDLLAEDAEGTDVEQFVAVQAEALLDG